MKGAQRMMERRVQYLIELRSENHLKSVYGRQDGLNAMTFKSTVFDIHFIAPNIPQNDLVAA